MNRLFDTGQQDSFKVKFEKAPTCSPTLDRILHPNADCLIIEKDEVVKQVLYEWDDLQQIRKRPGHNVAFLLRNYKRWALCVAYFYGRPDGDNGFLLYGLNRDHKSTAEIAEFTRSLLTRDANGPLEIVDEIEPEKHN